jgi:hypothetical protein
LILVPLSPSIFIAETVPGAAVDFGEWATEGSTGKPLRVYATSKVELPTANMSQSSGASPCGPCIVPFWCVKSTPDTAAVNMIMATVIVKVSIMVGKKSRDMPITIPVMQNNKAIAADTELLQKFGANTVVACAAPPLMSPRSAAHQPESVKAPTGKKEKPLAKKLCKT